jgi:hypothetical protein
MTIHNLSQGGMVDILEKLIATVAETPSARRVAVNKP